LSSYEESIKHPGPLLARSLAVVLPRYGKSLGGGAETLVRALVEHIWGVGESANPVRLVERLEVWTTCAADHRTWENFHPPGMTVDNGIVVRRFPVSPRDLEVFIRFELALNHGRPVSITEQLDWLANSVNSHELYAHIAAHAAEFDAIIFAPYLFATCFWGALIAPERSILIPCLHNEPYAYLDVFHHLFHRVRGFLFNTQKELELAQRLYGINNFEENAVVVGMGFKPPPAAARGENGGTGCLRDKRDAPFLLYSGRKETGKNLDFLIECFADYRRANPGSALELRLMGAGEIEFLKELPPGVIDLGFVSEEEKEDLMTEALALCQPSTNESFSIVMMEAWLRATPVIVHGDCAVTRDHVVRSGGGLYFTSAGEFAGVVDLLLSTSGLPQTMGKSGQHYVQTEYSWAAVTERLLDGFARCFSGPPVQPST